MEYHTGQNNIQLNPAIAYYKGLEKIMLYSKVLYRVIFLSCLIKNCSCG